MRTAPLPEALNVLTPVLLAVIKRDYSAVSCNKEGLKITKPDNNIFKEKGKLICSNFFQILVCSVSCFRSLLLCSKFLLPPA